MNKSNYIYLYNGSFISLLNLIKILFQKKIIPQNIKDEDYQSTLLEETFMIKNREDEKVIAEINKYFSSRILKTIYYLYLTNYEDKELLIYYFLLYARQYKNKIYYMRNLKIVTKTLKLEQYVSRENHKFKGILRFKELGNGILYAEMNPENNIIFLLVKHFQRRLKEEAFIIKDVRRGILGVYDKKEAYFVDSRDFVMKEINYSSKEEQIQEMWKDFYKTIGIKERKNDRCRRNFMPKKYWKYIIEVSDEK